MLTKSSRKWTQKERVKYIALRQRLEASPAYRRACERAFSRISEADGLFEAWEMKCVRLEWQGKRYMKIPRPILSR